MPKHSGPQNDLLSGVSEQRTTWGHFEQRLQDRALQEAVCPHIRREDQQEHGTLQSLALSHKPLGLVFFRERLAQAE